MRAFEDHVVVAAHPHLGATRHGAVADDGASDSDALAQLEDLTHFGVAVHCLSVLRLVQALERTSSMASMIS